VKSVNNNTQNKNPTDFVCRICFFSVLIQKLSSFNLAGTKAAGAYGNGSIAAVYNSLNLSYVGLPNSVGLSVGMGNVVTESNALSTYGTLCHLLHLQIKCYKNSNTL
jgi:hypothetical protein